MDNAKTLVTPPLDLSVGGAGDLLRRGTGREPEARSRLGTGGQGQKRSAR